MLEKAIQSRQCSVLQGTDRAGLFPQDLRDLGRIIPFQESQDDDLLLIMREVP